VSKVQSSLLLLPLLLLSWVRVWHFRSFVLLLPHNPPPPCGKSAIKAEMKFAGSRGKKKTGEILLCHFVVSPFEF